METSSAKGNFAASGGEAKDERVELQHGASKMKIVVAIDESDESFYVLKWVLEKFFRHSTTSSTPEMAQDHHLSILHVMHRYPQYVFPGAPAVIPAVSTANRGQKESAAALVSQAVAICQEKKVVAETIILEGDAKESICQATEDMHVDLLVVGSRGRGKIKRAFLGSVSDYCAHHANCPVVIVKSPKETHK
ncbi:hypothetical protein Leryth_002415 [Lithospermum erythrorhizon]|nr:hypothetical protein Leryth_002415 [Lithospermum erythrorhizon]